MIGDEVSRWCDHCKKVTDQTVTGEGSDNTELSCNKCGHENFLIQGFNMNLM